MIYPKIIELASPKQEHSVAKKMGSPTFAR